jgi:hypothetical protein
MLATSFKHVFASMDAVVPRVPPRLYRTEMEFMCDAVQDIYRLFALIGYVMHSYAWFVRISFRSMPAWEEDHIINQMIHYVVYLLTEYPQRPCYILMADCDIVEHYLLQNILQNPFFGNVQNLEIRVLRSRYHPRHPDNPLNIFYPLQPFVQIQNNDQ